MVTKAPEMELSAVVSSTDEVEWTNQRTSEVKRLRFWQAFASGASILLLCTDESGAFRAYRAEECRAVQ